MKQKSYAPGPTAVRDNVIEARSRDTYNPDFDAAFMDVYKSVCDKYNKIIGSTSESYILCGEAILGLEAACASLTETKDRVLVLDNGLYGAGFACFVSMYGGVPVVRSYDYRQGIDAEMLREYLCQDSDFKYATLVHCDTPTGVLNDVEALCRLLAEFNILSVVDGVSSVGGVPLDFDNAGIDILIGGSQKAISAPAGLTLMTISDKAKKAFKNRKTPIVGFYANLQIWENYREAKTFPYTLPARDIVALGVALDNILEEGCDKVFERHRRIAFAVRKSITSVGLDLYLHQDTASTVSAIELADGVSALAITQNIKAHTGVSISTSWGDYDDALIRIGHMGENARYDTVLEVLEMLEKACGRLGIQLLGSLTDHFQCYYETYDSFKDKDAHVQYFKKRLGTGYSLNK